MIQHQSATSVQLEGIAIHGYSDVLGWDLYHGHFFVHVRKDTKNDTKPQNTESASSQGDNTDQQTEEPPSDKDNAKETKTETKTDPEKFVTKNSDINRLVCDLGILFHGKEFPKEYRASPYGPTYPIGSPGI